MLSDERRMADDKCRMQDTRYQIPDTRYQIPESESKIMTRTILCLLFGCLIACGGCASNYVVEWKAKTHTEWDKVQEHNIDVPGQPAYYALLPISVPFDIVTSPIQLIVLLSWPAAKTPHSRPPPE